MDAFLRPAFRREPRNTRILSWDGVPVCVVGGTGFLGLQIVRELHERGAKVRVLALEPPREHPVHELPGVELHAGDMRNRDAVFRAVAGCQFVFQAAGPVAVGTATRESQLEPHLTGTRILLECLPVECRLVHTSSIVAIGGTAEGHILDERTPFPNAGLRIAYVQVKRMAEELVLKSNRNAVVTNPGYLVGPEGTASSVMGKFCAGFWRGRMPFAPPGGFNFTDVRDAAAGHLLAAMRGKAGERYILGGENQSLARFLQFLARAADMNPRWLPGMPNWAFTAYAGINELRSRIRGRDPYPSLEHARLNRLFWYASSAKAERELGYSSRTLAESTSDAFSSISRVKKLEPNRLNRWFLGADRPAVRSGPAAVA